MKRPRRGRESGKKGWGSAVPPAPVYDFRRLAVYDADFRKYVKVRGKGKFSIDFSNRATTAALSRAILKLHFSLTLSLPAGQLVPTIPNRVQYLRWATGLLPCSAPFGNHSVLDIGTGYSCIYALLGARIYPSWHFIGTDINADAIDFAQNTVNSNGLEKQISLVNTRPDEPLLSATHWSAVKAPTPLLTVCNPPFFDRVPETDDPSGVAAGTPEELATEGGEVEFVQKLARESIAHADIAVFTTLVGVQKDVGTIVSFLRSDEIRAYQVTHTVLNAGGKTNRWAVAWSFGPRRSVVDVLSNVEDARWRVALSVSPGRKFANRMTGADVIEKCRKVMLALDWSKPTSEDGDVNGAGVNAVTKVLDEKSGETRISISCSETDASGRLGLLLKVERRGGMRAFEVFGLGKEVALEMRTTLNKKNVV